MKNARDLLCGSSFSTEMRDLSPVLRRSVSSLKDGHSTTAVLDSLRAHYKTPCSFRNKISSLRLFLEEQDPITFTRVNADLTLCADEKVAAKRFQNAASEHTQRNTHHIDADSIVSYCRNVLEGVDKKNTCQYERILCLLALTGRRQTELLNGRSVFLAIPLLQGGSDYECIFSGQLKTKTPRSYRIPLLAPCSLINSAVTTLHTAHERNITRSNELIGREEENGTK